MDRINGGLLNAFIGLAIATMVVTTLIAAKNILIPFVIALMIAYFIVAIADAIALASVISTSIAHSACQ